MASIPQIIAAINPDAYLDTGETKGSPAHKKKLKEFKELIEKDGILKAAGKAKAKSLKENKLVYDSPTETLEPIYFFILDLMNDQGLKPEKLVDNFVSSPGSQHFGDMGMRKSQMQQQGSKLLGDINTVLRSILNIIYDLREFKIRLKSYEDYHSDDKEKRAAALLSLKQIWMDKVDYPQRQNSSIKAMAIQGGFNTLIDAFLVVNSNKEIDDLDLNQIVKRILKPRLHDFQNWLNESEGELKKRFSIEKTYLKSQVNSLKIYSRWTRPYLKAAQELEMSENSRDPGLVKMFNSLLLELTLLGKKELKVKDEATNGDFPPFFAKDSFLAAITEKYYSCVLINFKFRGIPSKTQQGFVVGGRAEVTFSAYALTGSEIDELNKQLDKADIDDALGLIQGATTESLEALKDDIAEYIEDKPEEKKKEEKKKNLGDNPFAALFGSYNKREKKEKKEKKKFKMGYMKHTAWYEEEYFMPKIKKDALETAFNIFEIYKKAHGMPSFPPPLL